MKKIVMIFLMISSLSFGEVEGETYSFLGNIFSGGKKTEKRKDDTGGTETVSAGIYSAIPVIEGEEIPPYLEFKYIEKDTNIEKTFRVNITETKAGDRRPAEIAALENAIAAETVREKVPPMMRYYESAFKRHLENISGNSEKIYLLGNQYFINKKYERAKDIFSKNIDSEENLFGAALTNRFLGYDNTAIDYYSEVIDMNSGIAEAYLGRGICYRNTGRYREALADFLKYKSMKNSEEAYTALGNIYILREEYAKAKQILTEGRVLYPNSELISELLVKAYGN